MATNNNMPGADGCRVQNIDSQGLCNRTCTFVTETLLSATRYTGSHMIDHDVQRLNQYLDVLEVFINEARPGPMDLNCTHNQIAYPLNKFPHQDEINDCENETLKSINFRLMSLWIECANCQSGDLSNGFVSFDAERFLKIINSCRGMLSNIPNPVDLPESGQVITAPGSK